MTDASPLQTVMALALVLGLVLLAGWLLQRLGGRRPAKALAVVSQVSLGQKERVVVVAWDGQEWMLGVGPGRVNLIAHRDGAEAGQESPAGPGSCTEPAAPVGARPPGRSPSTTPTLPHAFAHHLRHTLGRWSQR